MFSWILVTCVLVLTEVSRANSQQCQQEKDCTNVCPLGYTYDQYGCVLCEKCRKTGIFENDIIVNGQAYDSLVNEYDESKNTTRKKRSVSGRHNKEWPRHGNFIDVPYIISNTPKQIRTNIDTAIREFHSKTCIRFVERQQQPNYIDFRGRGICSSSVGMIGNRQLIRLGFGCQKIGTVIHEMMHALGFWHEQSRGDRDDYIEVIWGNIRQGQKHNFMKRTSHSDFYGSRYDTNSVMQYGGYYLSVDERSRPTIINRSTGKPVKAQREGFSEQDLIQINTKYGCTDYLPGGQNASYQATSTTQIPSTASLECVDKDKQCPQYAQHNYCKISEYVRTKLCVKTCSKCEDTSVLRRDETSTQASTTTASTTITTTATTTTRAPTTTTKSTTTQLPTTTNSCINHYATCDIWAVLNYCSGRYEVFMTKWCALSCDRCS